MREIAEHLGRAPSTLYREVRRNQYFDDELPQLNGYHAIAAQRSYERRRAVHRKLIRHPRVRAAVVDRLKAGWSPEQIAGRMKFEQHPVCVSHETIYRFAYSKEGKTEQFYQYLPERRRLRRRRGMRRRHGIRFPKHLSIEYRPDAVGDRDQFGHWECDPVQFRKEFGKANVTSLVERVSRFTVVLKNLDRSSRPVMEGLIGSLAPLPADARRSITFDRGTEFTAWKYLKAGIGVDPWCCDPQAPWQKGTVENTNNRLRRYLPRKKDPTFLTQEELVTIGGHLNATPRKCLGWRTPAEVFRIHLRKINS